MMRESISYRIFKVFNYSILTLAAFLCLFPMLNIIAISFSGFAPVMANKVVLIPIDVTLDNYKYIFESSRYLRAMLVSLVRVVVGTFAGMTITILTAYPLARHKKDLTGRNVIMWYFIIPMLFSGGLIPFFLVLNQLNLINSFFVMILPYALQVWYVVLMTNFFKNIDRSFEEAATIDGAGPFAVLLKIYLPLSIAAIATMSLFTAVDHWNAWFDGLVFINDDSLRPLQSMLMILMQRMRELKGNLFDTAELARLKNTSDRSLVSAQVIVGTLPILAVYPFVQKYFITGIQLGAVKE